MSIENEILGVADRLVSAFGSHDRQAYFAAFSQDATFLFHNLDRLLPSRAAYETEWALWESRDGFQVVSCTSSDRHVNVQGDVAIFTHRVATKARFGTDEVQSRECETIVFRKFPDAGWLGVHEHLSLDPAQA